MPVKPIPAYVAEHINKDNIKSIFNENILRVLDDVKFADLLGLPHRNIKAIFARGSSAFESLSKTKLQIEAGDGDFYERVRIVFTKLSLEVYNVLCGELRVTGSCYIVSTSLY